MEKFGIEYINPEVILLNQNGLGISEIAARTCYDSYNASNNKNIQEFGEKIKKDINFIDENLLNNINNIEESELLYKLTWAVQHHSILEHMYFSFFIKNTSRGVLQEHARHRIQAISVRSTRYTMSDIINIYLIYIHLNKDENWFIDKILELNLFITIDKEYNILQIKDILNKLNYQKNKMNKYDFYLETIVKENIEEFINTEIEEKCFEILERKKKRNIGDNFKHIVNDNWKVDMVVSFNLRSLKNYFKLRDSGAVYFQIQELAKNMKKVIPEKYLNLIIK